MISWLTIFMFLYRLIELDEGIEALEVAINYKTDNIESQERQLRSSFIKVCDLVDFRVGS